MKNMNLKYLSTIVGATMLAGTLEHARATVTLFEARSNVDGVAADQTANPLISSGLGTLTYIVTGIGPHFVGLFLDTEIDLAINGFANEAGSTTGAPAGGQTWEIDEPGFDLITPGDIYMHFNLSNPALSLLDNTNPPRWPDDVSMALGWNFNLLVGETATVSFTASKTAPAGGFYLTQSDASTASPDHVYFSSDLRIGGGGPTPVPDGGGTLGMLSASVALMGLAFRRKSV